MKKLFLSFLCLLLAAMLNGCGNEEIAAENSPLVKTKTISLGAGVSEGNYPGAVKGRYETPMSFQVGGRILQRFVQAGDRVHAGDVLMTIDSRDVVQQATQGEAQVAAAKAQLSLARSNLNRYKALYEQEAVSASVLEQYQTSCDAAEAAYNQAVAIAKQGKNAVGYSKLIAATDGVISSVTAEVGQVVAAGQQVISLVQSDELEVEVNLPENRIGDASLGQKVDVSFWSLNNQTVTGIIREISPMADTVARTYRIRIALPQPPKGLMLGMTASAKIIGSSTSDKQLPATNAGDFVVLPMAAIYQTGDQPCVWVVDANAMTLSLKAVQVEDFDKNQLKVRGLDNGDIVVTAGVHKLHEGAKVRLAEDDNDNGTDSGKSM